MMKARHRFSTADVPERQRFTYWQAAISETFVPFDCVRTSTGPFAGELSSRLAGEVNFCHLKSRDHLVKRGEREILQSTKETILLHVQLSGTGVIGQDGRDVRLRPGEVAFFDSTRPSSLAFDGDFELLVVHLPRASLTKTIGRTERFTALALNANSGLAALLAQHLSATAEILPTADDAMSAKLAEIAVGLIGATVSSLAGRQPDQTWSRTVLIYRAKAFAEQHIGDPHLGTEQVAKAIGISGRYLQSLFRADGTTFSDWIWTRRLELCRHRLSETASLGCNIGQIAFECGFSDFSHFSRRFRDAFGSSARDFRSLQKLKNAGENTPAGQA